MLLYYALIYYVSITIIIGIWFSAMDIKTRKIKNKYMAVYFALIAPLFVFINFTNLFSTFFVLLLFYAVLFVFYMLGIFGGADFKYLGISIIPMFVLDGMSWRILFNFLFIIACALIGLRIGFYLLYNRKIHRFFKSLFDYLDISVGPLQFLKVMLYYPLCLSNQKVLESIPISESRGAAITFQSDPYNINFEAIENFADIDLSDYEYDKKICSGEIRYIGKIKLPKNHIKINEKSIVFYQPAVPLIPLLFFVQLFMILSILI